MRQRIWHDLTHMWDLKIKTPELTETEQRDCAGGVREMGEDAQRIRAPYHKANEF